MSVFLPLRVELVTPDDLCSFNLLFRDFPRSRTAGKVLSFGRPEIFLPLPLIEAPSLVAAI